MHFKRFITAFALLYALLLTSCEAETNLASSNQVLEFALINGSIYTVDDQQSWAEAMLVENGVITAIGSNDEVLSRTRSDIQTIDLDGLMVMPGFHDVHLHAVEAGINENLCFFEPFLYLEEYADEVADCAEFDQRDDDWVLGAGINVAGLLDQVARGDGLPIDFLDEAVPDRPVLILDDIGHGAVANTRAMEAAGYDQLDGNPPGGVIDRDPATGRLTGIVLENAQQSLRTAAFEPTSANLSRGYFGLLSSLDTLNQNGITSISDAGGYWTRGHHQIWERALNDDTLTVRASNALYLFPDQPFGQQVNELKGLYTNDPTSLLRFNQVKIYTDGILSQGTGLVVEPYAEVYGLPGVPAEGFPYFDTPTLNRYAQELDAAGFQMHFHVTGDKATRLSLNAIEQAITNNSTADARHRLTHLYLVHPNDRPRFADLDVIADFQLAPSSVDRAYLSDMETLVGPPARELLPAFDLYDQGATITISSDWDADALSPFVKMESILFQDADNIPPLETIIEWMTINSAYLLHQDDITGSLEVGKQADFVVLDQNIFDVPAGRLSNTRVLLTYLGGREVYRSAGAP
ncbi:MAG: amidohydrolase [Chloroflexota bacterium]